MQRYRSIDVVDDKYFERIISQKVSQTIFYSLPQEQQGFIFYSTVSNLRVFTNYVFQPEYGRKASG